GVNGDFYIDTAADAIYGPKTAGAWGSGTSLIGPQGEQGETGAAGADGADTFLELTDAPSSYASQAGKFPKVNTGASALEFVEGVVIVKHGATAATARPTAAKVEWWGSVAPDNKVTGDTWFETGAFD